MPIKGEKLLFFLATWFFKSKLDKKRGSFGKKTWQISMKMKELLQNGSKKCKRG